MLFFVPASQIKSWEEGMNYCFNWLIIRAYRNGLIDRKKFVSLWETVQYLGDERKLVESA